MIISGIRKRSKIRDHRQFSFPRTFGVMSKKFLDVELDYDAKLTNRNQFADGLPLGCTGETTADISTDDDGVIKDPTWIYQKTCEFEGHGPEQGCYITNSLKMSATIGLKPSEDIGDSRALSFLRGKRFEVHPSNGLDWFDALRSALILNPRRSISAGTLWAREWNQAGPDGIVTNSFVIREEDPWHNWKICGITFKNGEWMLIGKSWQGENYGDKGFHYLSRATTNRVFGLTGSEAYNQAKADKEDIETVQVNILTKILSLLAILLKKLQPAPITPFVAEIIPTPQPVKVPEIAQISPVTVPKLSAGAFDRFIMYMADYEGDPGDRNYRNNNLLNFKLSPVGYAPIYGVVREDKDGFAIFRDKATGNLYAHNFIRQKIKENPDWTILDYVSFHAPASDHNTPVKYATNIAARSGVDMYYKMVNIINS